MRACGPSWPAERTSWMLVTVPMSTPLNFTGAPMLRPFTDPGKYMTPWIDRRKNLPEPNTSTPSTARAMAPSTNAPTTAGLAFLPMGRRLRLVCAAREEAAHGRLVGLVAQRLRVAVGDGGARLDVEEDAVVADGEDAGQLVGDDDDGGAEAVAQ